MSPWFLVILIPIRRLGFTIEVSTGDRTASIESGVLISVFSTATLVRQPAFRARHLYACIFGVIRQGANIDVRKIWRRIRIWGVRGCKVPAHSRELVREGENGWLVGYTGREQCLLL